MIISKDRLERAYIGAQLIEEGFEVEGSANLIQGVSDIRERKIRPELVIIDASDQDFDKEIVRVLYRLIPDVPLLLIHGAWDNPQTLDWAAGVTKLTRPVTVVQVVGKVKEVMSRKSDRR